jgi:uncharacterized protein (DUF1778 family)
MPKPTPPAKRPVGRPRNTEESSQIGFRIPMSKRVLIEMAAEADNLDLTTWCTAVLMEAANKTLAEKPKR